MLAAASMGATAFQKGLGGVHAIAHPVGSWFNTHHGLTNAVILPYVMTFNRSAIEDKADVIARVLDLPARGFDGFFAWVLQMRRELGRIHLGTFTGPAGTFRQCTELPKPTRDLLARLSVETPRKIHELTAGT